jgi:hypothetical protein
MRPDIVGFDQNGQVRLVAEVKNRRGVSSDWATQLRRNIVAHSSVAPTAYFLLVLPDQLYLWKPTPKPELDRKPDWHSTVPEWVAEHTSSTSAFELSSFGWLSDLTRLTSPDALRHDPAWTWATESGLADSLRGGRVEIEPDL